MLTTRRPLKCILQTEKEKEAYLTYWLEWQMHEGFLLTIYLGNNHSLDIHIYDAVLNMPPHFLF